MKSPARAFAFALCLLAGGCSSVPNAVNPVAWYRDISGASKDDSLDKDQSNAQNLAAGGKEPYPNLASVPNAPENATGAIDRQKLEQSLVADRANAHYTDEELRAGAAVPGLIAPPPPANVTAEATPQASPTPTPESPPPEAAAPANETAAAPPAAAPTEAVPAPEKIKAPAAEKEAEAAPPAESTLQSPTIPNVPAGTPPQPPPPPPEMPAAPKIASAEPPPSKPAPEAMGRRLAAASSSVQVAAISFADGSAALTSDERDQLSQVAAMQHGKGGEFRIVGHSASGLGDEDAQQRLAGFTLALNRAKAVAQMLGSEGVPSAAIAIEAAPSKPGDASIADVYLEH
jgi:outer membrane protein OmpA-like peptidoglycan-associated protein